MTFVRAIEQTFFTILRSRELFALAILSVLFYAFYYPAPYEQQTANDINLVVVDADRSPLSRALVRHLSDTRTVHVLGELANLADARELIHARKADGVLYFAPNAGQQVLDGRGGSGIALWLNGSYFVRAEAIGSTLAEVALDAVAELEQAVPALSRQDRQPILEQPIFTTGGYRDYVFPAVANIILQQTLMAASARLVADRRRRGWQVMKPAEALGMLVACATIGMLSAGFYFGLIYWIQDVPHGGNMPGLLISMPLFAFAVVGLGMFAGSLFRNGDDALKVLLSTSLPLLFLGGFAWPLYQMPDWLATIAWLSPATVATHLFIRFNQMGATLSEARGPLLMMAALALVYTVGFLIRIDRLNRQQGSVAAGSA
jgi:ABC-2 type transport system permease protein